MIDIAEEWQTKLVKEIRRKAIHLSGLSVPFGLLVFGRTFTATMIALALVVALVLEWQRLKGKISLPEVRVQEEHKVASYIYYITGSLLCVLLFPTMIAVNAMLLLSLGDTVSGLVGSVLSKADVRSRKEMWSLQAHADSRRHVHRVPFDRLPRLRDNPALLSGLFCGSRGCYIRRLRGHQSSTIKGLDDNLSIPIFSGLLMSAAAFIAAI